MPASASQHFFSVYHAPRGYVRMLRMGDLIAQRHLTAFDRLIGIIGDSGSGKSLLIKGMFPGLELTNDDNGVNVRPLPILDQEKSGFFEAHTYHLDVRFESAFTQMHILADAVRKALNRGKRVVVEHFDLLYPQLDLNAELLVSIGEEIHVARPTIFGPEPKDLAEIAFRTIRYRRMAHTAEDLVERYLLTSSLGRYEHGDVRHGFTLQFSEKPDVAISDIEAYVLKAVSQDLPVSFLDDTHILLGDTAHYCTGPRVHVASTGEIENFRMLQEIHYDPMSERWLLVGLVGAESPRKIRDLNVIFG